ncbi:hypothetical protein B0H10DRAFT_630458 [Mycena sp. CBHHK59/15]|nr:hypothetical protein B0H10DRAFT_630458 [Mycena sp. CBHHK59/15]
MARYVRTGATGDIISFSASTTTVTVVSYTTYVSDGQTLTTSFPFISTSVTLVPMETQIGAMLIPGSAYVHSSHKHVEAIVGTVVAVVVALLAAIAAWIALRRRWQWRVLFISTFIPERRESEFDNEQTASVRSPSIYSRSGDFDLLWPPLEMSDSGTRYPLGRGPHVIGVRAHRQGAVARAQQLFGGAPGADRGRGARGVGGNQRAGDGALVSYATRPGGGIRWGAGAADRGAAGADSRARDGAGGTPA